VGEAIVPAAEPYSIGKYVLDSERKTWKAENPHSSYHNVFTSHSISGASDWAYNHNRLTAPGRSKITVKFKIPVEELRR